VNPEPSTASGRANIDNLDKPPRRLRYSRSAAATGGGGRASGRRWVLGVRLHRALRANTSTADRRGLRARYPLIRVTSKLTTYHQVASMTHPTTRPITHPTTHPTTQPSVAIPANISLWSTSFEHAQKSMHSSARIEKHTQQSTHPKSMRRRA
jgi:hypothetical protein